MKKKIVRKEQKEMLAEWVNRFGTSEESLAARDIAQAMYDSGIDFSRNALLKALDEETQREKITFKKQREAVYIYRQAVAIFLRNTEEDQKKMQKTIDSVRDVCLLAIQKDTEEQFPNSNVSILHNPKTYEVGIEIDGEKRLLPPLSLNKDEPLEKLVQKINNNIILN